MYRRKRIPREIAPERDSLLPIRTPVDTIVGVELRHFDLPSGKLMAEIDTVFSSWAFDPNGVRDDENGPLEVAAEIGRLLPVMFPMDAHVRIGVCGCPVQDVTYDPADGTAVVNFDMQWIEGPKGIAEMLVAAIADGWAIVDADGNRWSPDESAIRKTHEKYLAGTWPFGKEGTE